MTVKNIAYFNGVAGDCISDIRIFDWKDLLSVSRFSSKYVIYRFPGVFHGSQVSNEKFDQNFWNFRFKTEWIGSVHQEKVQKTGPPFEVDCFSRLDRFDRKFTVPFDHSASTKMSGNFGSKLNGSVRSDWPMAQIRSLRGIKQDRSKLKSRSIRLHKISKLLTGNFCSMDRALSQYKIFNISKSTATNCWLVPDLPIVDLDQYNNL